MNWLKNPIGGFGKLWTGNFLRRYLIIGIVGVAFLFWLIPKAFDLVFDIIWFVIKLPFRLLYLIFVTGIGGLLGALWGIFSGFFGLFGTFGLIVKWIIVVAVVAFAAIFICHFFEKNTRR